ncbi:MAG: DUF4054 domain-containing protein [Janthinobacterium lividum]
MKLLDRLEVVAPELTSLPENKKTDFLLVANEEIRTNIQGTNRDRLIVYLAAHYMTLATRNQGASGEVTSITEGKLSVTYSNNTNKNDTSDLALTKYGLMYKRLIRSYAITPMTVMCF